MKQKKQKAKQQKKQKALQKQKNGAAKQGAASVAGSGKPNEKMPCGFTAFFRLFTTLRRRHLFAFLYDALFVVLMGIGLLVFGWLQVQLQLRLQGINASGIVAGLSTGAAAPLLSSARFTILLIFAVALLFVIYAVLSWTFTRALIWRTLLPLPLASPASSRHLSHLPQLSFARFWLKFLPVSLLWTAAGFVLLGVALSFLGRLYETPPFLILSRTAGYSYIALISVLAALLFVLYAHISNMVYLSFARAPRFRALWDGLVRSVILFPRLFKPFAILLVFFIAITAAGTAAALLPEPFRGIMRFAVLLFFSLISRAWYVLAVGSR